jgi:hypothetical protein
MNRMTSELRLRVTRETTIAIVALALPATWLGGVSGGLGVLAAGLLNLGNFWWLSRAASASSGAAGARRRELAGWIAAAAARFTVLFAAFAALCASGYAHPVAVVVGLTVLPCALIARGLRAGREAE